MKWESKDDDDLVVIGSDVESDHRAVVYSGDDTSDDGESGTSSDASVSELKKKYQENFLMLAPVMPAANTPASSGGPRAHNDRSPLWEDTFFTIPDKDAEFIMIRVRSMYYASISQSGPQVMSKQVMPDRFGEPRDDPSRSILVLRAWAVLRARQNGWADAVSSRKHHVNHQESLLERDIRALREPCGLLGSTKANDALQQVAPDMVVRLLHR